MVSLVFDENDSEEGSNSLGDTEDSDSNIDNRLLSEERKGVSRMKSSRKDKLNQFKVVFCMCISH